MVQMDRGISFWKEKGIKYSNRERNSMNMLENTSVERFLEAQNGMYECALSEIRAGEKRSHWMWYIFPQLRALGRSETAMFFGIEGSEEAKIYLSHPILSARLVECCEALLEHENGSVYDIFGDLDSMKLRSSMTLFAYISEGDSVFCRVLEAFYDGNPDFLTIELLNAERIF